jgi:dUTP pyrophosphatase
MRLLNWTLGPDPIFEVTTGRLPTRGSEYAAGFDLYAPKNFVLEPGIQKMIPLGIKSTFRNDWVALIWDRSKLGKVGIHRLGGVIDSDYRGEWKTILINHSPVKQFIKKGDRIGQVIFQPIFCGSCSTGTVELDTKRGTGGFGSTDK